MIETLDALIDIEDDLDKGVDRDSCIVKIRNLKDTVKYRVKLIRIADQEEGGWETVRAYERSSLADDEDDDRRIKDAVATAKRKLSEKSKSMGKRQRLNLHRSESPSNHYEDTFGPSNQFAETSQYLADPGDLCFRCGAPGHWSNDCPNR